MSNGKDISLKMALNKLINSEITTYKFKEYSDVHMRSCSYSFPEIFQFYNYHFYKAD